MTPAEEQPVAPAADAAPVTSGAAPVSSGAESWPPLPVAEPGSLLELVLKSLDDDQAQEVVVIPLEGKSAIADYMIVASGRSNRQVASIAEKLAERVKHGGFGSSRIEGLPAADWVLVDSGDIICHVFRPEVRTFYNLERMWAFGDVA